MKPKLLKLRLIINQLSLEIQKPLSTNELEALHLLSNDKDHPSDFVLLLLLFKKLLLQINILQKLLSILETKYQYNF